MEDLTAKSICHVYARMEAVYYFDNRIPRKLDPGDFDTPHLCQLREHAPLILPFKDNKHGIGLRHVIHPVAHHLTDQLHALFEECQHLGGYTNSWKAFQYELALEELFYGKPHTHSSKQYSISLGTNSTSPDSITKQRGFLGLAPVGSASVGLVGRVRSFTVQILPQHGLLEPAQEFKCKMEQQKHN